MLFTLATIAMASLSVALDLSALQWRNRVLVVFAEAGDNRLLEQQSLIDGVRDGLAERDMLVLSVEGQGVSTLFGDVSGFDADAVRSATGRHDDEAFEAVLIGKDGSVKQRWTTPVEPKELFRIIDAMPMRANEMRR